MDRRLVPLLTLVAACGRWGFTPGVDANDGPGDNAAATADAPVGGGSYTVTPSMTTYVSPPDAVKVPGFVPGTSDDESLALDLPFPFTFYGITYGSVQANVNGFLTFGVPPSAADARANECPLDGTAPDAVIAVFWDDLTSNVTAPQGLMSSALEGTAPDRRFTVEWRDMDAYYQVGGGGNAFTQGVRVTQKIVLHESGVIELVYGPRTAPTAVNKDCGAQRHQGCSATIGVEAASSSVLQTIQCGTAAGPAAGYVPIVDGRMYTLVPS